MRTGPYHEGHGAEPTETEALGRAKDKDKAEGASESSDRAPSESSGRVEDANAGTGADANAEASTMMHVEFVKVLTVLLVIALVIAAWPETPEDD